MATHVELASAHMPKKLVVRQWTTRVSTAHECNVTSGQYCMWLIKIVDLVKIG